MEPVNGFLCLRNRRSVSIAEVLMLVANGPVGEPE